MKVGTRGSLQSFATSHDNVKKVAKAAPLRTVKKDTTIVGTISIVMLLVRFSYVDQGSTDDAKRPWMGQYVKLNSAHAMNT